MSQEEVVITKGINSGILKVVSEEEVKSRGMEWLKKLSRAWSQDRCSWRCCRD
jgi:hypothetical protein